MTAGSFQLRNGRCTRGTPIRGFVNHACPALDCTVRLSSIWGRHSQYVASSVGFLLGASHVHTSGEMDDPFGLCFYPDVSISSSSSSVYFSTG